MTEREGEPMTSELWVNVMIKPEFGDPGGEDIMNKMARLGIEGVYEVRQGKRFRVTVEGGDCDRNVALAGRMAAEVLASPVTEEWFIDSESIGASEPNEPGGAEESGEQVAFGKRSPRRPNNLTGVKDAKPDKSYL